MMENQLEFKHNTLSRNSLPLLHWLLFFVSMVYIIINYQELPVIENKFFRFNGFSVLMWLSISFLGAIISSYASNYLQGFKYHRSYNRNSIFFTLSVLLLVVSNSIWLFIGSWITMGYFISRLIGVNKDWAEAREASNYTLRWFLLGSLLLSAGITILALTSDAYNLNEIIARLESIPAWAIMISSLLIITAALIQSAIYPFHRWLLSAMTAPNPASALMHAGFVNGSGILLTIFAVLVYYSNTYDLLFIIGGLTAVIAQFTKLQQVQVKHKLACSTIAQMGFMIMQCGLGYFNAAIAHLILHGFYKAYLFLSAGEEIKNSNPVQALPIRIKPYQALIVLTFSVVGAVMFLMLTGKEFAWNSSIFLTLIVAITVGQATYNIIKETTFSFLKRILFSVIIFSTGIGMYALMFNGVAGMLETMPMVEVPRQLSFLEIFFGILFLLGFFFMKLGKYRQIPWLYVKLLNISQPAAKTIHQYKSKAS